MSATLFIKIINLTILECKSSMGVATGIKAIDNKSNHIGM